MKTIYMTNILVKEIQFSTNSDHFVFFNFESLNFIVIARLLNYIQGDIFKSTQDSFCHELSKLLAEKMCESDFQNV